MSYEKFRRPRRRNSEVLFSDYFCNPYIKGISKTEMNYAHGVDLLLHSPTQILLAKNLIFKEHGKAVSHQLLRANVLTPLRKLKVLYKESRPEIEYERRIMSLVQFLKVYGFRFFHKLYMKTIERIIDEFRPAIFIELYHPNLKQPIDELIEFMKSEFCHINLLYGTVDMKTMAETELNEVKISEKLRKFYIPILGLLTMAGTNEPEVIKEIKMILNSWKVESILKNKECDKDRVPMGISDSRIPDLLRFVPTDPFFMDDLPLKYEMPKKIDKAEQMMKRRRPITLEKSKELMVRRCASVDRVSASSHKRIMLDKILFALSTPPSPIPEHKTISDNETSDDEEIEMKPTVLFNLADPPKKVQGLTSYQKLSLMNPYSTLRISEVEPSILDEKPPIPSLSHPNSGDFMAIVALEAMQVLPREWINLLQDGELTVMCRSLSQKGLLMIKGFSSLQRPPEQVLNVLLHSDITKPGESIFPCFSVIEVRPYFDVIHFQVETVKGLTPREWAGRRSHVKDFPCERGFTMLLNNMEAENILVATDAVKGKVLSGGIIARPIGKKATQISLVFKVELGGLIPVRIMQQMIVVTLKNFITDLRRFCDVVSEYDSEAEAQRLAEEVDPEFIQ